MHEYEMTEMRTASKVLEFIIDEERSGCQRLKFIGTVWTDDRFLKKVAARRNCENLLIRKWLCRSKLEIQRLVAPPRYLLIIVQQL